MTAFFSRLNHARTLKTKGLELVIFAVELIRNELTGAHENHAASPGTRLIISSEPAN